MSRKTKEEYYRSFTVTDPRTHEKGHTEYRVTARFVSKKRPEDVKEVVVWRRYSELKKLHGELSYTHRNLFRRQEDFPPFPPAQLFGRFDEAVIEERRKAAEAMLLFTTSIPALYNSPQLKEFFRGGEVKRPLDPSPLSSSTPLPPPLIPLPTGTSEYGTEEEEGIEEPALPEEARSDLGAVLGEPEAAVEAYSEMENSPTQITPTEVEPEPHTNTEEATAAARPGSTDSSLGKSGNQEEFDSLFDSVGEELQVEGPPPLSDTDLAIFDPCAKEDQPNASHDHSELLSLPLAGPNGTSGSVGEAGYLTQAANELNAAMEKEKEGEYSAAILIYKTAVDILIKGAQGDPDAQRRESVKRKTAQYLKHAEMLLSLQTPTPTQDQDRS
ncbi:sorting nexin-15 isoform X1 [Anguilla rostrata]|uniref:sorting nexin-15 isoform X1 n=1 Tax=Anguilla rostrata TaxID=7938 RepID=UPI0030CCEEB2